uniref:Uncharacterized protein n=1 Tax=Romanomermis culicivorax TaxID=13658 RepID=A0A915IV66_ROMCU
MRSRTNKPVDTVLYSGEQYFSAVHQKLVAVSLWPQHYGLSLDFLNYLLALTLFAAVYPSTFWRANKAFGAIFSLHSLILAFSSIFSYLSLKIMYRLRNSQHSDESSSLLLASSDANLHNPNNNRYSTAASGAAPPVFILDDKFLLALNVATTVILYASTTVVYGYGYNKFCIGLWLRNSRSRMRGQKTYKICCEGYSPHIAAIFMLILMVACKSPLLYDEMLLYQQ